jgi:hypothetical protein
MVGWVSRSGRGHFYVHKLSGIMGGGEVQGEPG